jgi:hypothetical protein
MHARSSSRPFLRSALAFSLLILAGRSTTAQPSRHAAPTEVGASKIPRTDNRDIPVNLSAALNRTLTIRYGDAANLWAADSVSLNVGNQGVKS